MHERKGRVRAYVTKSEADGVSLAREHIAPGTTVHADEAGHWDKLAARFPIKRINHQVAYSLNGACTNSAESFFSRVRRSEKGIHHHLSGPYLQSYVTELAWREDFRREWDPTDTEKPVPYIEVIRTPEVGAADLSPARVVRAGEQKAHHHRLCAGGSGADR